MVHLIQNLFPAVHHLWITLDSWSSKSWILRRVADGSIDSGVRIKIKSYSWIKEFGHGVVIPITLEKSRSGSASG